MFPEFWAKIYPRKRRICRLAVRTYRRPLESGRSKKMSTNSSQDDGRHKSSPAGQPGPRILVIEDESTMRLALRDVLETEGYRVLTAADGEAGLEMSIGEKPDLIILDIMLPKIDGFSLCSE